MNIINGPSLKTSILLLFLTASHVGAQVQYTVDLTNHVHHEARITATFSGVALDTFTCQMARSSPGRYALHEFVKNVYAVEFRDARNRKLPFVQPNPYEWAVPNPPAQVTVAYTLFGDHGDGTYNQIDATHAHLNAPATWMWAPGFENAEYRIRFILPGTLNWKVATQLDRKGDEYRAPNFQFLMDSPVEISDHLMTQYEDDGKLFRIVFHADSTAGLLNFTEIVHAVTSEAEQIFGNYPDFEGGHYTFLTDLLTQVDYDGMEHRNSTVITHPNVLRKNWRNLLRSFSHEFFHAWNVERLRPKSLEPFDFMRVNRCGELWLAEGFTNYYDGLLIKRAGGMNMDEYAKSLAGPINTIMGSPGRTLRNASEMSGQAGFVDAARSVDATNLANTYISYYTFGDAIGLGLDLTLRTRWNKSLDDYMRLLWNDFGRPEKPYKHADLKTALGKLTQPAFADTFFARYIEGHDVADYRTLLASAGFLVRPAHPDRTSLSLEPFSGGQLTLSDSPLKGSPLYRAGMDRGDTLTVVNGVAVQDTADLWKQVRTKKLGDSLRVEFRQNQRTVSAVIHLEPDPTIEVVPYEYAGMALTQPMHDFRTAWLTSKTNRVAPTLTCSICRRDYPAEWIVCPLDGGTLVLKDSLPPQK